MERSKSGSAVRSGPGRQMLRRCIVLAAVFGIGVFAVLLARLYQLQIKEHAVFQEDGKIAVLKAENISM